FSSAHGGNPPTLSITFNTAPYAANPISPPNGARVASRTPILSAGPRTDDDGDNVQFRFHIATNPDAESGAIYDSGWLNSSTWTVPAGANALVPGVPYYWHVYASDGTITTNPTQISSFTIDLRLGEGGASPTDTLGPATVNLATGNLYVHPALPTFPTIGGNLGVDLAYNSLATLPGWPSMPQGWSVTPGQAGSLEYSAASISSNNS